MKSINRVKAKASDKALWFMYGFLVAVAFMVVVLAVFV